MPRVHRIFLHPATSPACKGACVPKARLTDGPSDSLQHTFQVSLSSFPSETMRDGRPASCSRMHQPLSTGIIRPPLFFFDASPPPRRRRVHNGKVPLGPKGWSKHHPPPRAMPDLLHDPSFQLFPFHANVPLPAVSVPFNSKVFVL